MKVEIDFPGDFASDRLLHHALGRLCIGPLGGSAGGRLMLSPAGEVVLVLPESARQYVRFSPAYDDALFGLVPSKEQEPVLQDALCAQLQKLRSRIGDMHALLNNGTSYQALALLRNIEDIAAQMKVPK